MSKHETPISKPEWRNIGRANTAVNGKRGGGGGLELSQNFKSWTKVTKSPKMDLKIIVLAEAKFVWLNQFFLFTKEDSKNLNIALWIIQGLENKVLLYIFFNKFS